MTIAIDYDGTWTADPALWTDFAGKAAQRGHRVVIATARHHHSDDMRTLPNWMEVFYTKGKLKEEVLRKAGVPVHIWIDDMPGMIQDCLILRESEGDSVL